MNFKEELLNRMPSNNKLSYVKNKMIAAADRDNQSVEILTEYMTDEVLNWLHKENIKMKPCLDEPFPHYYLYWY